MSLLFYLIVVFGTVDSNLTSIETSSRLTRTSERSTNICQTCRCSTIPSLVNCSTIFNLDEIHSSPIVWDIVDFSFRQLEFFDDQQILSLRMRHFFLNSNRIRIIADRTFDSLVDVLIVLDLSNNSLVNLSSTLFNEKFLQLKTLNLSRNEIEQFPSDLRQCSSLNRLDFSSNRLKTLPRFALNGLNNLTWLSLADNRDLTCVVQDSFKYLKSLKFLDLSKTNLIAFDACIFIQLTNLEVLHLENLLFNCSSCWLPIARRKTKELRGQCFHLNSSQEIRSLTDRQLDSACEKSSIDCSIDSCEPGSLSNQSSRVFVSQQEKISKATTKKTIEILLGSIFGVLALLVVVFIFVFVGRWRQGKKIFCCQSFENRSRIAEATRRRRQQHKEIINSNPAVIESVVTHGANMNVSQENFGYFHQDTSNHKRKLFNPMFADSTSSNEQRREENLSDDQFYCEHL